MKKISLISLFIVLVITIFTMAAYASTTGKMEVTTDKSEYKNDDTVVAEVKISELESDTGVIGLGGTLEYDKTSLEFVKIENIGDWSKPTFNEANGKWITDRSDLTKDKESVFKVTFKVVTSDKNKDVEIKVSGVETSGGEGAFSLSDASKSIKLNPNKPENKPDNTPKNETNNNTQNGGGNGGNGGSSITSTSNTSISLDKNVNKTASGNLPKAGLPAPVVIILMSGAIVIAFVFYIKFEKISRKK